MGDLQTSTRQPNLMTWDASHAGFNQLNACFEMACTHHPDEYIESFYTLVSGKRDSGTWKK
jgi:hypothetical protein